MSEFGSTNPSEQHNPDRLVYEAERIVSDAFQRIQAHDTILQFEADAVNEATDDNSLIDLAQAVSGIETEMQLQQKKEKAVKKPVAGLLTLGVACVAGFAVNSVLDAFLGKNKKIS